MLIAGIVVLFIGFIFIISYPINRKKNTRCTMETQGTLVDIRGRFNSKGRLKSMHVYSYQVDGEEYQLETLDYSPDAENVGDVCTIWYNPDRPEDAQAFRGSNKYLKTLLIIGLVLEVLGIVLSFIGCAQAFA